MTAFLEECAKAMGELQHMTQNIHAWLQKFTEQKRQQLHFDQKIQNETERLHRSNIDYEAAEVKNNAKLVAWREQSYAFALGEAKQQQQHINEMDQRFQTEKQRMDQYERTIQHKSEVIKQFQAQQMQIHLTLVKLESELDSLKRQQTETLSRIHHIAGNEDISARLNTVEETLRRFEEALATAETQREHTRQAAQDAATANARAEQQLISATTQRDQALDRWNSAKAKSTLSEVELNQLESLMLSAEEQSTAKAKVEQYRQNLLTVEADLKRLESSLAGREMSEAEYEQAQESAKSATQQLEAAISAVAKATNDLDALNKKHERWNELESLRLQLSQEISLLQQLTKIFRGSSFVEYLAEEQLFAISKVASDRLIGLSRGRYRLELDSSGGFVIRDDANGGTSRPVSTLSGGETFLASLALALALSAQIQLSGKYPLEFFFLDEGFGTLDADLLDTVISALEKLHLERLTVGVISHVPELRSRLPRKLIVQPAEPFGKGSTVKLELM
jgi:exonuclease SbcC